uniref:DNA-directed RNA polymerase III subunit, putative n=1 Tax=Arundo donax TaxID=35708 RepID=A0A0A9HGH7_ARUDO
MLAPYAIKQSRSISPRRRPPSRLRPSVGCLVNNTRGPLARACILSSTMCFSF